jgi:hypothetical protein
MNPGQKGNAKAPIDLTKKWTREFQVEVEIFPICSPLRHTATGFNVASVKVNDVCEPLGI